MTIQSIPPTPPLEALYLGVPKRLWPLINPVRDAWETDRKRIREFEEMRDVAQRQGWMLAWEKQVTELDAQIEELTTALRLATCDCPARPDPTDVPLDNIAGHHDFSCDFRARMQPILMSMWTRTKAVPA